MSLDGQAIRPSRPFAIARGGRRYRFHHVLIRDTAYDGILKRARASFHERFVEWGDSVNRERAGPEYEEILGYHLEQAHQLPLRARPARRARARARCRRIAPAGFRREASVRTWRHRRQPRNLLGRAVALLLEEASAEARAPPGLWRGAPPGGSLRGVEQRPWTRRSRAPPASAMPWSLRTRRSCASSCRSGRVRPRAGATRLRRRSPRPWPSSKRPATTPGSRRHGASSPGHMERRATSALTAEAAGACAR